jgi:hypothetical protein
MMRSFAPSVEKGLGIRARGFRTYAATFKASKYIKRTEDFWLIGGKTLSRIISSSARLRVHFLVSKYREFPYVC